MKDLRLTEEGRELIYKGILKKRGGTQGDGGDLQLFLFDHALLLVKQKEKNKHEMHKVYRRVRFSSKFDWRRILIISFEAHSSRTSPGLCSR